MRVKVSIQIMLGQKEVIENFDANQLTSKVQASSIVSKISVDSWFVISR